MLPAAQLWKTSGRVPEVFLVFPEKGVFGRTANITPGCGGNHSSFSSASPQKQPKSRIKVQKEWRNINNPMKNVELSVTSLYI